MNGLEKVLYALVTPFARAYVWVRTKAGSPVKDKKEYKVVFGKDTDGTLTSAVDVDPMYILDHALAHAERHYKKFPYYSYRKVEVLDNVSSRDTRKGWTLGEGGLLVYKGKRVTIIPNGRARDGKGLV